MHCTILLDAMTAESALPFDIFHKAQTLPMLAGSSGKTVQRSDVDQLLFVSFRPLFSIHYERPHLEV